MNTTTPKVIREHFLLSDSAHTDLSSARQWRHAAAMAGIYRCPKAYRLFCRRKMRELALCAVASARFAALREQAHAA